MKWDASVSCENLYSVFPLFCTFQDITTNHIISKEYRRVVAPACFSL